MSSLFAQIPTLPQPDNGLYEQKFKYDIGSVIPSDLNGDGLTDFISRTQYVSKDSTIHIEFRLYNQSGGEPYWEFNTNVLSRYNENFVPSGRKFGIGFSTYTDVPSISWDWDNDGKWEVYFIYFDLITSGWRHRIVTGTGQTLIDAAIPSGCNWETRKLMTALCTYRGVERVIVAEDGMSSGNVVMLEILNKQGKWSLNTVWLYNDRVANNKSLVSHDMIRTADVDLDGSDDEILLGGVVLNSDGSIRYTMDQVLGLKEGSYGRSDQVLLGYFHPNYPNDLVMIPGDDWVGGDWQIHIAAVFAKTGEKIFDSKIGTNSSELGFDDHWHSGNFMTNKDGFFLTALDRSGEEWARYEITKSFQGLVSSGDTNHGKPDVYMTTTKWHDNDYDIPNIQGLTGSGVSIDLGGSGAEEIIEHRGESPENKLTIRFNMDSDPDFPSRWKNFQYRKDAQLLNSGYAQHWLGAIVGSDKNNDIVKPPLTPKNMQIKLK